MIESILVPLDGSVLGEEALLVALRVAERDQSQIELVLVHEPPLPSYRSYGSPPHDTRFDTELRHTQAAYLRSIANWLRSGSGVPVKATLLEGPVASTIAAHAATGGTDLIVMSSHGRGGLGRVVMGSTAETVVRSSATPVLLLKPRATASLAQQQRHFEHVLIPLDGSPFAEAALQYALEVGGGTKGRYTLLRVVQELRTEELAERVGIGVPEIERERAEAEAYLNEVASHLRGRAPNLTLETAVHSNPARAIAACAEDIGADLIAMATHGRGSAGRLLMGSVADKVFRTAGRPVLLVRPSAEAIASTAVLHGMKGGARHVRSSA